MLVDRWLGAHTLHPGCEAESGELQNTHNRAKVSRGNRAAMFLGLCEENPAHRLLNLCCLAINVGHQHRVTISTCTKTS